MKQYILTVHWEIGAGTYMFDDMETALRQVEFIKEMYPDLRVTLKYQIVKSEKCILDSNN